MSQALSGLGDDRAGSDCHHRTAKDYPSLEVFKYTADAKGNITTTQVFAKAETGPGALKKPEQPVKADLQ
jgi:hypothetical protein